MRKGHCLSVLLISVFLMIFVASMEAGQVASRNEVIPLMGPGAGSSMLQFKAGGHLLGFEPKKVYFASLDHALSVEFLGTAGVMPKAGAEGRETGNKSKAPTLSKVVYEGLWEGISLIYEPREGGVVESTYQIGPGADVSKIQLRYNVPVEAEGDGSLRFKFERGYLTESPPVAWQEIGGERVPVEVEFRVSGGEVGFRVGRYDPSYSLTIDPTYAWHTFYGASTYDESYGIAIDGSGNVYVTGRSLATWNGPAGQLPLHAYSGNSYADIFVLKLNSSGAYQWHTFYGSGNNESYAIAVDHSGNVYVTGSSNASWNGPDGRAPLNAYSAGGDIFVLKLDTNGTYKWHTFYGFMGWFGSHGIAIDGSGNVYVTGDSWGTLNGPAPANQLPLHAYSGGYDIFVLKLDSSGSYQWHTFYGSSGADGSSGPDDLGVGIAVDRSGNVYVTGYSSATWGSPLHAFSGISGSTDIFVLKLDSSGAYEWHTFYGSTNTDYGYGIAVDGRGNVYVTGVSAAGWPPELGPLHGFCGGHDIFVLKLDSKGVYQWHTFYGSSGADDYGEGIAVDRSGNVYVTGYSYATWKGESAQPPLHAYSGGARADIFLLKLDSSGSYQWHTFYGSGGNFADDVGYGIAIDHSGNVCATGHSSGTWKGAAGENPLHPSSNNDIFVVKVSVPPSAPSRGDFNNDGKPDILWRNRSTGQNAVWFMDGATFISYAGIMDVGDCNWEIVGPK